MSYYQTNRPITLSQIEQFGFEWRMMDADFFLHTWSQYRKFNPQLKETPYRPK